MLTLDLLSFNIIKMTTDDELIDFAITNLNNHISFKKNLQTALLQVEKNALLKTIGAKNTKTIDAKKISILGQLFTSTEVDSLGIILTNIHLEADNNAFREDFLTSLKKLQTKFNEENVDSKYTNLQLFINEILSINPFSLKTFFNSRMKVKYYFEFKPLDDNKLIQLINSTNPTNLEQAETFVQSYFTSSSPLPNASRRPDTGTIVAVGQAGGKPKCKKTTNKMMIAGRSRVIYEGARGGRYVKMNGKFVNIKKLTK
jgi:hypothetical protein